MSATMNRRSALGALASLPALAVLPSAAMGGPTRADAALLAMQPAIAKRDRRNLSGTMAQCSLTSYRLKKVCALTTAVDSLATRMSLVAAPPRAVTI
jgi:hypothetical protein